jgi:bacteriophage N4 adsorption protein B
VVDLLSGLPTLLDAIVAAALVPLAWWILLNGIDDIFVDVLGLHAFAQRRSELRKQRRLIAGERPEKRVAVVVPCWQEHAVIGRMIQQNIERIRYSNCDFFIGVYPNDAATLAVVQELVQRYPKVHAAVCPNDGPTSKADCLNAIWQGVTEYERRHLVWFDVILTHDAEDVIHPDSLLWISEYTDTYGMVQIPVLPLATPFTKWTHGVYCDEFAEYQTRDMPARDAMRSFIPSCGVGTGMRRDAVEMLAAEDGNVFEPGCLTEDYENGYRLRLRNVRQIFLPLHLEGMATREFFPTVFKRAVKQRTRWVTGIALQTAERHRWCGTLAVKYWLWRDRKGLINSPLSAAANLLMAYLAIRHVGSAVFGSEWPLQALHQESLLLGATAILALHRVMYRMYCVQRVYGWFFAAWTPVRMVYGNIINSVSALRAIKQYATAKLRGKQLAWAKTSHEYPAQMAFATDSRRIGELLVADGVISGSQLADALTRKPQGRRLGEHLVHEGLLRECDVYQALSTQYGLPQGDLSPTEVPISVARALPGRVARERRVLPFRVEFASMFLAVPELPTDELREHLRRYTMLDLRFQLITPSNFDELVQALL